MSSKQQRRGEVLGRLSSGMISSEQAGALLGLSSRQIRRVLKAFRSSGLASVVHGNMGRAPRNKTVEDIRARIVGMTSEEGEYHGLNTCHLHEMLLEREYIPIGRSTLDRLLVQNRVIDRGIRKQKTRRMRREESASEGMMLQIDGSPHHWILGQERRICLIGAIDDATGKIVGVVFRPTEDLAGYIMLLRSIAKDYGLPESLYHDKHTILRSPKESTIDDELAGRAPQSQMQRIISELGIVSIPADSPQAKGRIERLWGTLQDRLVKEMAMAGVSTITQANAFLPGFIARYNKRFAKSARNAQSAWVEIEPSMDTAYYFSARETRTVRKDHTISWYGKTLQIHPEEMVLSGQKMTVHLSPEEEVSIYSGKRRFAYRQVQERPEREEIQREIATNELKKTSRSASARQRAWLFGSAAV